MPFQQSGAIHYYTFNSLPTTDLVHAVFTRRGGNSPAPWAALNFGGALGDDAARVRDNCSLALQALGCSMDSIFDVWQVHGDHVVCAEAPRKPNTPHVKADAILTRQPGVTLLMRFADCVPILLYDPRQRVAGLAHAGWQGTVKRTALAAVRKMETVYGSQPGDILAALGPSICPKHYTVGPEVIAQVRHSFQEHASHLLHNQHGEIQFDLWAANRLVLEQAGVRHIEIAGICTACNLQDWFSHRGEHGKTGRFGVVIGLRE